MLDMSHVIFFLGGAFIIIAIPGPNILYLVARSIHQGRVAGLVSVLGIEAATVAHICAATLGLTSLLLSSVVAFTVVKYLGATYLIYLGVRKLIERDADAGEEPINAGSLQRVFLQGFLVNLFNPKTAMFFLAFLPQFVDPGQGNVSVQIFSYGLLLVVLALAVEMVYVLCSSQLRSWLKTTRGFGNKQRRVAGCTYIGLGLATVFSGVNRR